jgi:hypothetical protein
MIPKIGECYTLLGNGVPIHMQITSYSNINDCFYATQFGERYNYDYKYSRALFERLLEKGRMVKYSKVKKESAGHPLTKIFK